MRHRVQGRKLGRTSSHRKAMFRNQLTALFTHERIVTTLAKAKELRPMAERMVTLARTGTLPARRKILSSVPDREVVQRLFDDIAPRFADRPGGYTRILRMGRRHGDNAEIAILEFVDYELSEKREASEGERKGSFMDRAKRMFGGGGAKEAAEAVPAEEAAVEEPAEEPEAEAVAESEPEAEPEAEAAAEEPEPETEAPAEEPEAEDEEKK